MNACTGSIRYFVCGALAAALAGGVAASTGSAFAADDAAWIATWAASPQPVWEPDFFGGVGIPRSVRDQTVRQIGRVSIGGDRVRFIVSNEYGKEPLTIGSAHVALAGEGSATVPGIGPQSHVRRKRFRSQFLRSACDERSGRPQSSAAQLSSPSASTSRTFHRRRRGIMTPSKPDIWPMATSSTQRSSRTRSRCLRGCFSTRFSSTRRQGRARSSPSAIRLPTATARPRI